MLQIEHFGVQGITDGTSGVPTFGGFDGVCFWWGPWERNLTIAEIVS